MRKIYESNKKDGYATQSSESSPSIWVDISAVFVHQEEQAKSKSGMKPEEASH
jgi:hypothetical protein